MSKGGIIMSAQDLAGVLEAGAKTAAQRDKVDVHTAYLRFVQGFEGRDSYKQFCAAWARH